MMKFNLKAVCVIYETNASVITHSISLRLTFVYSRGSHCSYNYKYYFYPTLYWS